MTKILVIAFALVGQAPSNWPEGLHYPTEMRRYTPAVYTQRIFKNENGPGQLIPVIEKVERSKLEAHWQVPGGLEGAPKGWHSQLYKYVPGQPQVFTGLINVANGGFVRINYGQGWVKTNTPSTQDEFGWRRVYPDGTFFADVLSYQNKIFEIRYREKEAGAWLNYIAYRNPSARPPGFFRIKTNQCNSCHSQAGSGGYAVGLVPGGDGVLSDPFPALER